MKAKLNVFLSVFSVFLFAACTDKPVSQEPAVVPGTLSLQPTATSVTGGQPATAAVTGCSDDNQCPDKQLCVSGRCAAIHPGQAECALVRVHFDYGEATLKPTEYPMMARMVRCLKADHAMKLDIAGNADERGTADYNLALGERRARAVARYLENLGVSEGQLNTVSCGEDRPLCTEHNEECWQQNRRAKLAPK